MAANTCENQSKRILGSAGHIDSYYARTARPLVYFPPIERDRQCNICVVGGGFAGLATAMYLAEAGQNVMLLEARRIAWGASGRNGGFVSPGYAESIFNVEKKVGLDHARALYRASAEGVGEIRRIVKEGKYPETICGQGWLKMIRHGRTIELERRAERMARDYNTNLEFVDRSALSSYVRSDAYKAGLLDMASFHVQPLNLASLIAARAKRAGANLFENSKVTSVERRHGGWLVRAGDYEVKCSQVVIATSVYGGPAIRLNAAMQPIATYVITARASQGQLGTAIPFKGCIGDTRRAGDYYRIVKDKREEFLLWGGRITTRRSVPARLAEMLRRDILKVYPQIGDLEVDCAWSGLMGYAVHKMPIIRGIDDGLWAATAFGGHGLNTSVMAGRILADAITGRDDRIRLFTPYGAVWAGGNLGRVAAQLEYWRLQFLDKVSERLAGFNVR